MTRAYDFAVRFIDTVAPGTVCRVRLDPRFEARAVTADFPRNVLAGFLDGVVANGRAGSFGFREGEGNAVEIVAPDGLRPLSDTERAVVLNLVEFGGDFEAERSTTIEAVEFPADGSSSQSANVLLAALATENERAVEEMDALLSRFPSEEDDGVRGWPTESHERYTYHLRFAAERDLMPAEAVELEAVLDALHVANMWNGYSTERSAAEAVRSGRTGMAYGIETAERSIDFLVERPACNPALPLIWFRQRFEERLWGLGEDTAVLVFAAD